ncbi:rho guanine nucleotide exchange factor 18 [Protopterus annectens]|uniref:rho guanine nucleotide exchange factor 18 n=1 Tax=Protopterus annectens TaxID=7888 RepID=UPI001CFBC4E2|nr:rho guanine nucleotide exchange factor 18 [Protopterus annectens]
MADSPLNHSWPSFSKLWMKRWSFKRDCRPRHRKCNSVSGSQCATLKTTLTPLSNENQIFLDISAEGKDDSSDTEDHDTDFNSSTEDIHCLDSSLLTSEFYKDLGFPDGSEAGILQETLTQNHPGSGKMHRNKEVDFSQVEDTGFYHGCLPHQKNFGNNNDMTLPGGPQDFSCKDVIRPRFLDLEPIQATDTDEESYPTLVRSMSTSRRHSWDAPMTPVDGGRRFSLDLLQAESDGEREDSISQELLSESTCVPVDSLEVLTNEEELAEDHECGTRQDHPQNPEASSISRRRRSNSVILMSDKIKPSWTSCSLDISFTGSEGSKTSLLEDSTTDFVESSHLLIVQQVLQELKEYHGANFPVGQESSSDLTWFEFLSNENEESDKSEKSEKGTKVKRRLSNLKNRVTGSWQKDKEKEKEKDKEKKEKCKEKEPKERGKLVSGHHLVPGTFSICAHCSLCGKLLMNKNGLQCLNCAVNVHRNCKNLLAECSSTKPKLRESRSTGPPPSAALQSRQASLKEHSRSVPSGPNGISASPKSGGMTIQQHRAAQLTLSTAADANMAGLVSGFISLGPAGFVLFRSSSDELYSFKSSTKRSCFLGDAVYAALRTEIETDAQEFEVESWSLAVDQAYAKQCTKETRKRQDIIYEFMQTEMHHVRTLKIMLNVYIRAMKEELQFTDRMLNKILPCVEDLLELHSVFLAKLKDRRAESLEEGSDRNYIIQRIGDLLVQQFSGDGGERMKEKYGEFCSRHNEAVSHYKELLQQNKKFHNLIKKLGHCSIVRRLGVQECILLVTQRITKYPVLVERLIQSTEVDSEDHEDLTRALSLIKDVITHVDSTVNKYEKAQRLKEIFNKMDPKSVGRLTNGFVFRKEAMSQGKQQLLYEGIVYWKAASGRLKDTLAVLLTDVLLLLQEKDQKYVFASVDSKPPVISLQRLIVREVANVEKAMFLISALEGPEMYEVHTNSKEERNTWMEHIWEAVERCTDANEGIFYEPEEDRKQAELRAAKLREFQDRLSLKDKLIAQSLNEKLQIYSEMSEINGPENVGPGARSRALLRGDLENLQGESLLKAAVTEVENLQNLLASNLFTSNWQQPEECRTSSGVLKRADTFGGYDSSPVVSDNDANISSGERRSHRTSSVPHLQSPEVDSSFMEEVIESDSSLNSVEPEICQRVKNLSQLLYSLKAVVTQQDSYLEMQKAQEKLYRLQSTRGGLLLEQEKQRNFEKQREELVNIQKLQKQFEQDQQRWEREKERQQREHDAKEAQLREQEEECRKLREQLNQQKNEQEKQRADYQHDLERLREAQRALEKEKDRLEQQQKLKKSSTVTARMLPSEAVRGQTLSYSSSLNGAGTLSSDGLNRFSGRSNLTKTGVDYPERPEVVRRDSGSLSLKNEVPPHLLSTTNQIQKPAAVQQKIPTKLAIAGKKDKNVKGKASHRTESSASAILKQHIPVRLSGKDESILKHSPSAASVPSSNQTSVKLPESENQHDPNASQQFRSNSPHMKTAPLLPDVPQTQTDIDDEGNVIFF